MNAPADYRMQQEMEEERARLTLEALNRVARGMSNEADAVFLAAELGLKHQFSQERRA